MYLATQKRMYLDNENILPIFILQYATQHCFLSGYEISLLAFRFLGKFDG